MQANPRQSQENRSGLGDFYGFERRISHVLGRYRHTTDNATLSFVLKCRQARRLLDFKLAESAVPIHPRQR
jgi:hypothetical protein